MKLIKTFVGCLCLMAMASCGEGNKSVKEDVTMDEGKNAVIETIMARRSIRKYKDEPVSREVLDQIMECGINAPNGQNKQSWEVRVVDKPEVMAEIKNTLNAAYPNMSDAAGCFRGAPVMVFLARAKSYDFSAYDCGLMAENMMLSAWSLGVGSICLGSPVRMINDNPACAPILERLGFSEGYEFCLCVGLGYADEAPAAKPRDKAKVKYVE
ncbi:MAG: nitroreductase [Bacteroidaceae bacterium]|nr:nitroreductase [Bacteroidaceae bacterium]MBR3896430.1 nitroreductase [Bacteroidaceae bacterium]